MVSTSDIQLALRCLDLTSLNDGETEDVISALCTNARREPRTAAVCVEARFIKQGQSELQDSGVRVATVVNFPFGVASNEQVIWEVKHAVLDGADEVDIVWHYHAFLDGDEKEAVEPVRAALAELARVDPDGRVGLKIIVETSALEEKDPTMVQRAGRLCLGLAGAPERVKFLKTSTGKLSSGKGASFTAARALCQAIKAEGLHDKVGVKVSGGIRTTGDSAAYIDAMRGEMGPDWVSPERFRIGASGLWSALVGALGQEGGAPAASSNGNY